MSVLDSFVEFVRIVDLFKQIKRNCLVRSQLLAVLSGFQAEIALSLTGS